MLILVFCLHWQYYSSIVRWFLLLVAFAIFLRPTTGNCIVFDTPRFPSATCGFLRDLRCFYLFHQKWKVGEPASVCEGQRRASPLMKYWWHRLWFCNRYFWSSSMVAEGAPPPSIHQTTPPPHPIALGPSGVSVVDSFLLFKKGKKYPSRRVPPLMGCLHFEGRLMKIRCADAPLGPVPCWPSI